jgi:hypothetical protein
MGVVVFAADELGAAGAVGGVARSRGGRLRLAPESQQAPGGFDVLRLAEERPEQRACHQGQETRRAIALNQAGDPGAEVKALLWRWRRCDGMGLLLSQRQGRHQGQRQGRRQVPGPSPRSSSAAAATSAGGRTDPELAHRLTLDKAAVRLRGRGTGGPIQLTMTMKKPGRVALRGLPLTAAPAAQPSHMRSRLL